MGSKNNTEKSLDDKLDVYERLKCPVCLEGGQQGALRKGWAAGSDDNGVSVLPSRCPQRN